MQKDDGGHLDAVNGHKVILFDGVCGLCNSFVDFVIVRDRQRMFKYAPLQGQAAAALNPKSSELSSVQLYVPGKGLYSESDAVLRVFATLPGLWKLMAVFRVVPSPIRDVIYRWIAKNRYKWFGQRESCRLPSPEERELFLD